MKSITTQNVINSYRRYAPLYDVVFGAVLEPGRRKLTRAIHTLAPTSLLEVGVGTGLTLFRYPAETKVVGVDISDDMLEYARKKAKKLSERDIALHAMNAECMDFPDHSFDCVTVPYVLSVTPNPTQLIKELRRVCKPGGTILILNHFSGSRAWWLLEQAVKPLADKIGFRSDFHFSEHVTAHSWDVLAVTSVNLFGLSKLVTIRNA
jgi:phosphatidylethanolamine/phosphatidyl-N-methylethanolamine N-methyltransferase